MSNLNLQVVPFASVEDDIRRLVEEHWREVTSDPEGMPLDPDWNKYVVMDGAGLLFTMTARDNGALVGYIIHLVYPALHYKTVLMASDDAHFIRKSHRTMRNVKAMFDFAEEALSLMGVNVITYHGKTRPDINHQRTYELLGYKLHEQIFIKRL